MWNEAKNKVTQSYHKSNEAFYDKMVNVSYTQNVNEKKNILNSSRKNATQNDIKSTINTRKPRNYAETEDKYIFDFPPQKKKKIWKEIEKLERQRSQWQWIEKRRTSRIKYCI